MPWKPQYVINQELLVYLSQIEAVKSSFEKKSVSPKLLLSLHQSAKLASTHFSTQIEGNRLSQKEVETLVYHTSNAVQLKAGHDAKEVRAYYNALEFVEKSLDSNAPLSESLIQKAHALIEGAQKPTPYRTEQNAIYNSSDGALVYLPPEAKDVKILMKELVLWVNDNVQTLPIPVIAGIFHYQFVTIHPYLDGNGRTARLITSFLMQRYGYGLKGIYALEEYYAKNLPAYYSALETHPHHNYYYGRNNADITPWLVYFMKGVAEAFAHIAAKADENRGNVFEKNQENFLRKLDLKQRRILELFSSYQQISTAQAAAYLGVSDQSARLLLNKWVAEGFLKLGNKAKKNRTYVLTQEYELIIGKGV